MGVDDTSTITQSDIARRVGLHRTTVSMALRNDPRIAGVTRQRILRVAEEMGYRPNPLVDALMTQVRAHRPLHYQGTIAVLDPWSRPRGWSVWPCNARMLAGIKRRAEPRGFKVDEFWMSDQNLTIRQLRAVLQARGIVGVILMQPEEPCFETDFDFSGFACASVGLGCRRPVLPVSLNHQYDSVLVACRELWGLGYRRIALWVYEGHNERVRRLWTAGYASFQLALSAAYQIAPLVLANPDCRRECERHLEQSRPDAILASDKHLYDILRRTGCSVPDDVGFALLDKEPDDALFAGIDQLHELVGQAAVDLVLGAVYRNDPGVPRHPHVILTPGEWSWGPTVRAAE